MLSHEQEHGHVVGIAIGDAGQGVGGPRSCAGHGYPYLTGSPSVSVGDLYAQAFVTGGKRPDGGGVPQRLPERGQASSRKTRDIFDSFLLQGSDHCLGAIHDIPLQFRNL